jgi:hypothetical protein
VIIAASKGVRSLYSAFKRSAVQPGYEHPA